jgi:hypothetical protein
MCAVREALIICYARPLVANTSLFNLGLCNFLFLFAVHEGPKRRGPNDDHLQASAELKWRSYLDLVQTAVLGEK